MLVSDYLSNAAKMLGKENAWCQGASARDAEGKPTCMGEETAVAHCLDGALYELSLQRRYEGGLTVIDSTREYRAAIEFLEDAIKVATTVEIDGRKTSKSLVGFNDDAAQTQENVVAFLNLTAAQAAVAGK